MDKEREKGGRLEDLPVIATPEMEGTTKRVVFGPGRFWDDYVVRFFTTRSGSRTPFHSHDWPHYILILEGQVKGTIDGRTCELEGGCWAYVPPGVEHVFENVGTGDLKSICMVPKKGDPFDEGKL